MSIKQKYDNAFITKQAIKEYEKKQIPIREQRDYSKEHTNQIRSAIAENGMRTQNNIMKRSKFLRESKDWLLGECLYKIYNESLSSILSEGEQDFITDSMKHAMIYSFIEESGGASRILRNFRTKNVLLSELYNCVEHYHDLITESVKKKECCDNKGEYMIPSDIEDDFYKELDTADFGDVTIQISNRVMDAIDTFVTDNNDSMNNIKEILSTTRDKISAAKRGTAEAALENVAKRKITDVKNNRSMNLFGAMMEQTSKSLMKDDSKRDLFIENGSLDVGKVKTYCAAYYTMLEMVNSLNIAKIDADYIKEIIESL